MQSETKHKKILLIYHSNICNRTCGINSYFYNVLKILWEQGFQIDIFVPQSFDSDWSNTEFITNVFLPFENNFFQNNSAHEFNWIGPFEIERFKKIADDYDYIIFSYVYYAELVQYVKDKSKNILSMSDFCSLQKMQLEGVAFDAVIAEEIRLMRLFNTVIGISTDEISFFLNFTDTTKYFYVPHFLPVPRILDLTKNIDVLFLGSDNPHNVSGVTWFLENVYPQLKDRNYKIVIAGKVCQKLNKAQYPQIEFLDFANDLENLFSRTKLSLCPLFSGTGLKIKIVEAMSYGVPVVCTFKSMIGFPEKYNNGCIIADTKNEFINAINKVLLDSDVRLSLVDQARHQYEKYFNENFVRSTLENIFGEFASVSKGTYYKPLVQQQSPSKSVHVKRNIHWVNEYRAKIAFVLLSPKKFIRKYVNIFLTKRLK